MQMLIETLKHGGCYWKRDRWDSPGHSIAIANATPFKIRVGGPRSREYITGICKDGYFIVSEGEHAEIRFASAHEAVNTVREPSSNAFLHLEFKIQDHWIEADVLRRRQDSLLDPAEEMALQRALSILGQHPKGATMDLPALTIAAANYVARRPNMIVEARDELAIEIDLGPNEPPPRP